MTSYHLGIVLGLTSAVTFVVMSLWSREIQHREGPWRYLVYISVGPAVVGMVSWLVVPPQFSWPLFRGVMMAAAPALVGMFFMGLAVRHGDISHVGPVMGSKALVITALAAGLGFEPVAPQFWVASGMLLVALLLVSGNREVIRRPWRVIERALVLGLLMCTFTSLADLISRREMAVHHLSFWEFLTVGWVIRGTFCSTILLVFCAVRRLPVLPRKASTFWITAPIVMAHGIAIVAAFKLTNSAVLTNILTSLRGVGSVAAVLLLAHWSIGRRETLTRPMIAARVVGSLLICAAVWVALAGRAAPPAESADPKGDAAEPATSSPSATPPDRDRPADAGTRRDLSPDGEPPTDPDEPAAAHRDPRSEPAEAVTPATPATLDELYRRMADDLGRARPIIVTVHVCLCDNRQGIVPVSAALGDGDNPATNLYWGAMYGVRVFLGKAARWTLAAEPAGTGDVLRQAVFTCRLPAGAAWGGATSGRAVEVVLVARAWRGLAMEACLSAFARDVLTAEALEVRLPDGRVVAAGGAGHVVGFVGHNGLMGLPKDEWPFASIERSPDLPPRGWFALACKSDAYFAAPLDGARAVKLLATRQFMAPEAYTLAALVEALAARRDAAGLHAAAAEAYARYQPNTMLRAAMGVFAN